jgi:hypothetical protein
MRISLIFVTIFLIGPLFANGCSPPPSPTSLQTPYPSRTPTSTHIIDSIEGSFRNQISYLEEKMPRANSEGYVVPSETEQGDFGELVVMISADDLARAAQLTTRNHYELIHYTDRGDDNAVSYLLREQKPIQKGWGLYAFRVDSKSNIIIEAPHPRYDRRTPTVAMNIYRALDARALLIAGAHRNANSDGSADVAHAPESIFHSVHVALSQEIKTATGDVIILQIHGFHTSKHDGYPQAVFGFGEKLQGREVTLAKALERAFSEQGITVGLCTGYSWQDLCGTTNVQASVTNGGVFVHIELDEKLRKNDDPLIAALVQVFGNGLTP